MLLQRSLQTLSARGLRACSTAQAYMGETEALAGTRILVTGATGQVGTEMVPYLRKIYGHDSVIASDIRLPSGQHPGSANPGFVHCDVLSEDSIARVVLEHGVTQIVHLAGVLSAIGEKNPDLAMKVNARGFENMLNVAKTNELPIFAPSTIAVFGPSTPKDMTPDDTVMRPSTIYGVCKVGLELLGEYYSNKFGVDFRSLRYPGVISNVAWPGGGTTDWAVEVYYSALKTGKYTCFVTGDTVMPMMYMPDCLQATHQLMTASPSALKRRVYNVTAVSFTPEQMAESIRRVIPDFEISYAPDQRQEIAGTWPRSIDDSHARADWSWKHQYDLDSMTDDMLRTLEGRLFENGKSEFTQW